MSMRVSSADGDGLPYENQGERSNLNGKFKEHGSMGLRNFHYGYTINIGYDHFALSATYYRPTIFKEKHGPQVQQINIGLTLML